MNHSAIEELVSSYHDAIGLGECEITDNARAELAQLRAAAAERDWLKVDLLHMTQERDELQRHHDALYSELAQATGHEYTPGANFDAHEAVSQLVESISQQAAKLEQASAVILSARSHMALIDWYGCREFIALCDEWLNSNAPAPQEERTA